jgi:hypothetical protein
VSVDPVCGEGYALVVQYATWCGKVNVHSEGDAWVTDSDCTSGCNINTVDYCQKFWPEADAQVTVEPVPGELKTFKDAGCGGGYDHEGFAQYACCAPVE